MIESVYSMYAIQTTRTLNSHYITLFRLFHTSTLHIRIMVSDKSEAEHLVLLLFSLKSGIQESHSAPYPHARQLVVGITDNSIQGLETAEVASYIHRQTRNTATSHLMS